MNSVPSPRIVFDRPLYSFAEASRLLGITNQKMRRWIDGTATSAPVIRREHTGADHVTWAEFVEAGFLREYRVKLSLQRLRPLIDAMRRDFDEPYPLAHFTPLIDPKKKELLIRLQD